MTSNKISRICVYCGSSVGRVEAYQVMAKKLGGLLAQHNIELVYGGADVGIMGLIADEVLNAGGNVIGVMPRALVEKEVAHHGLSKLYVVESMHERKAKMAELSDGFIALPGGLGTLEELFEIMTWAQLGFHQKPIGLLNVNGFYDGLLTFLEHAVTEQYIKKNHQEMLIVEQQPALLLERFISFQPVIIDKWIGRKDL